MSSEQTTPVKTITVQQHYHAIHDIYVLLDDGDRRTLRAFGLTLPQYAVLRLLDLEKGRRLTSLSKRLLRSKSSITRIVDQLERDELVRRVPDPDDRRAQRVYLTPAGAARYAQAYMAHECSLQQRFSVLSEAEQQQLALLLDKLDEGLRVNLEADPTQP